MKYLILWTIIMPWLNSDQTVTPTYLTGRWIDLKTKSDTLTFETVDKRNYIILGRAESCYGLYSFKLLSGDKISLSWFYSSISGPKEYYFKQSGDFIEIEEFYCMKESGKKLTFKRLN